MFSALLHATLIPPRIGKGLYKHIRHSCDSRDQKGSPRTQSRLFLAHVAKLALAPLLSPPPRLAVSI